LLPPPRSNFPLPRFVSVFPVFSQKRSDCGFVSSGPFNYLPNSLVSYFLQFLSLLNRKFIFPESALIFPLFSASLSFAFINFKPLSPFFFFLFPAVTCCSLLVPCPVFLPISFLLSFSSYHSQRQILSSEYDTFNSFLPPNITPRLHSPFFKYDLPVLPI